MDPIPMLTAVQMMREMDRQREDVAGRARARNWRRSEGSSLSKKASNSTNTQRVIMPKMSIWRGASEEEEPMAAAGAVVGRNQGRRGAQKDFIVSKIHDLLTN